MQIIITKNYDEMSTAAAEIFAQNIKENPTIKLGLATGSTPIGLYKNLIEKCNKGELDFSGVTTFNLDEYYPISPDNNQSYIYFMKENLFNHININMKNVHIPNGMADDIDKEGEAYDALMEKFGYTDIQLLGVGRNGHIAFNEPDEFLISGTHKTGLTQDTIEANARFFDSIDAVPKQAITMGVGPIMKSKKVVVLISGANKHEAFELLKSGKVSTQCPITLLNLHRDAVIIVDEAAATGK